MNKAGPLSSSESTFEALTIIPMTTAKSVYSQQKKKRQHGNEAVKSHILAARTVANIVKTSLVWLARSLSYCQKLIWLPGSKGTGQDTHLT